MMCSGEGGHLTAHPYHTGLVSRVLCPSQPYCYYTIRLRGITTERITIACWDYVVPHLGDSALQECVSF